MVTISGVPVGTHNGGELTSASGCAFDRTRVLGKTVGAVRQGPFPAGGGGIAQPPITNGTGNKTVVEPRLVTLGFATAET